jgi:hypothetical protein
MLKRTNNRMLVASLGTMSGQTHPNRRGSEFCMPDALSPEISRRSFSKVIAAFLIGPQLFAKGRTGMTMDAVRLVGAPDSKIVRQAQDFAREASEPYLFNHVMRSWLFAAVLAKSAKAPPDPELLAMATLLHDLGLTERHATDTDRFEVDGANAARDFLQSHHFSGSDLQLVWDAIALHSTRSIALHKEPVVAFCHHGVQVDISGVQFDHIDVAVRQQILQEYPRLSLKSQLTNCLCAVIRRKPATTYDNFIRDFGERYVPGYQAHSSVDRLNAAPFES